MKSKIQLITPEIAAAYLEMNVGNRPARIKAVQGLAQAIKRGEWLLTPQGISFSTEGRLLDGQHRLMAVVESGVSVEMLVYTNVDPEAFMVMDRGTARTISDVTKLQKRTAEILTFFHEASSKATGKPTAAQILRLNDIFGVEADNLMQRAPSMVKGFSQVGVRAAVVLLSKEGVESAVDVYRRLTLADFSGAAPIVNSMVRQVVSGRFVGRSRGGSGQFESFAKSIFALDPKNADRVQLVFSDDARKESAKRLMKFIEQESVIERVSSARSKLVPEMA